MLAIYDGEVPPRIDPSIEIDIEGNQVGLAILVDFFTFFVMTDDLHENGVFFS